MRTRPGSTSRAGDAASSVSAGAASRSDQVIDHLDVAVGVHGDEQMAAGGAYLRDQRRDDRQRRAAIGGGQRRGRGPEAVAEHLGITDAPELAAEPAEVVAQPFGPRLVEQRPERAEVAAQAPGGDPRLVHVLGVDGRAGRRDRGGAGG